MTDDFSAATPRPRPTPAADDVERARAIMLADPANNPANPPRWPDDFSEAEEAAYRTKARAAIAAMPQVEALRAERDRWKESYEAANAGYKAAAPTIKSLGDRCEKLEDERDALRQALAEAEQALETIGREPNVGNWVFAQTRAALARIREITGEKI